MSSNLLLEDDDDNDAMFGDEEEEEEEEDVDMPVAAPVKVEPVAAAVKEEVKEEEEETAIVPKEEDGPPDEDRVADGEKIEEKTEEGMNGASDGVDSNLLATTATATTMSPTLSFPASSSSSSSTKSPLLLPTTLPSMSPSPFPHHNTGPTSDRLRNAMQRIAANPTRDAEAWQALITEAQSCWRSLGGSLHKLKNIPSGIIKEEGNESEVDLLGRKLDWIEACYGALLHHFPYAVTHYVQLVEMQLRLSALTQDEEEQCGPIAGGLMGMMGAQQGGAQGSALSNPAMSTPDQGVAISPAGLLMTPTMANSGTERQKLYDTKLDRIFQLTLGVTLDGSPALHGDITSSSSIDAERATTIEGARTVTGGLAPHSMDLWLLYVRKRYWDSARSAATVVAIPPPPPGYMPVAQQMSVLHQQYEESLRSAYRERKEKIREGIGAAYECALERGAGFGQNNHLIWKRYANYVKSWTVPVNYAGAAMLLLQWLLPGSPDPNVTLPPADPAHDHTTTQKQLSLLRSIYQRGITHPMTGLDQFWQEYESFERSHSESLGSVLIAEWLPRYQHARSIYLERNRVWTVHELKVVGRLAVPPVGCESGTTSGVATAGGAGMGLTSRGGAGAADDDFGGEAAGAGAGTGGMTGTPTSEAELIAQLDEERIILSKWRRRSAYERTNPERLSASDHAMKVRSAYREEVCAFARHPEVWHEWSSWELLHGSSSAAATTATSTTTTGGGAGGQGGSSASSAALIAPAKAGDWRSGGNAIRAVAVLSLGMESLPGSALLAQSQAGILERHLGESESSGKKDGSGNCGVSGCIKVMERFVNRSPTTLGFVLLQRLVRRHQGIAAARAVFARARRTLKVREEDMSAGDEDAKVTSIVATEKQEDVTAAGTEAMETGDASSNGIVASQHQMVTNRLKASVGASTTPTSEAVKNAGLITWHLYAAHATIEHRLSKNPKVAARIYELGLRKHRTFLSNPPYVLHYANLLLELNDEENLRSLLMRSVAACEEEEATANAATGGGSSDVAATARRREMQRPLWDMMLKFESILSSRSSNGNASADISSIEARRRRALYGPANEDVVLGGEGPPDDDEDRNLGTGMHKSSLNEQLVRVEGYDVASRIANGMGRMVDLLTVTGAIGNGTGELDAASSLDFASAASASMSAGGVSSDVWGDECAGGPSDISYVKRLKFQRESRTRAAASALGFASGPNQGGGGAGKLLTRERSTVGGAAGQAAANALALQNAPEWLRPLLQLLPPVPKFGRASTVKPPPHLTEMALSTLRGGQLPAARPVSNGSSAGNRRKRGRNNGGDSSDEENGNTQGGGYSNQFRSRQRSRLVN